MIYLDKSQLILQIRANPSDPQLYELWYCPNCRLTVAAGGIFPTLEQQTSHAGHALVWLPGQDSPLPGFPAQGHIRHWLETNRPDLTIARYAQLECYAATTGSGNWVWLLHGPEQTGWLRYLNNYLERLALSWLEALNGQPSEFFPEPARLWWGNRLQPGKWQFGWSNSTHPYEQFSELINPALI